LNAPRNVVTVDDAEWSASGDAGDSTDEGVPDAVSERLWCNGRRHPSVQAWQVLYFWVASLHSAGLSLLILVLWSHWMASLTDWSLGETQAEEDDWMWVVSYVSSMSAHCYL